MDKISYRCVLSSSLGKAKFCVSGLENSIQSSDCLVIRFALCTTISEHLNTILYIDFIDNNIIVISTRIRNILPPIVKAISTIQYAEFYKVFKVQISVEESETFTLEIYLVYFQMICNCFLLRPPDEFSVFLTEIFCIYREGHWHIRQKLGVSSVSNILLFYVSTSKTM